MSIINANKMHLIVVLETFLKSQKAEIRNFALKYLKRANEKKKSVYKILRI